MFTNKMCPCCQTIKTSEDVTYIGEQATAKPEKVLLLYQCNQFTTTMAEKIIKGESNESNNTVNADGLLNDSISVGESKQSA